MAKAKTPRSNSSVTPINRKPSEVKELRKSGNGNLEEEIRHRAYELFQERGGEHGRHHEDWLRAEAEIRARYANRTA
ncbi:MAG TPA: DUF2934 domain-containing protein [Terriglobales bacterium]|jgi:hypothetical protein|nr:DUF2934 domain-containing protein [Terriglobales bacterium]